MAKPQRKSGGDRKHDRNLVKCQKYRVNKIREKNKIKRILQSNGIVAAEEYAANYALLSYLKKIA